MYRIKLFPSTTETNILFGSPRAIRSDQYLIEIPNLVSQDINNEPLVNTDMADGTNLGTNNQPTKSIFTFFRPNVWIFFLSNNIEFNFSFYWWSRFALLLISTYLLLLQFTKKNLLLSITGSLLFFFTPFIQWWVPVDGIITISFGLYSFIKLLDSKKILSDLIWGFGLTYWIISFVLILYPPFQIPMMYASIFIALGMLLKKRLLLNKEKVKRLVFVLLGIVLVVALFTITYMNMFKEVIEIMTNTVYPGARFIPPGQGYIHHLNNGFYNLLMQKDSNGAPYANQSEASNFFMLYIPLLVWIFYKNIRTYIQRKKIDVFGLSISFYLILMSLWYFLPLPDFFSKYSLLYMVPPQRLIIGLGFMNYLLIFYTLSKKIYSIQKKDLVDWILTILLVSLTGVLMYFTGKYLYNSNPSSFNWPEIVSSNMKILMVSIFVPLLLGLLLMGYRKIFLLFFLGYAFISTVYINPLYRGLDILINTDLANYIEEVSTKDDSKWIFYNNHYFAQYALANNANVFNGIHIYPQFETWEVLDPEGKYKDIYNRYAHVMVSEFTQGESLVELTAMDALTLNIDPCDDRLSKLGIKYFLSTKPLNEECLRLDKTFNDISVFIYSTN